MVGFTVEDMERYAADMERRAKRFEELQGRMAAVTATGSSPSGRVTVTVDNNGVPSAITLSAGARGADPSTLAAEIMSTMRSAQARLRTVVSDTVRNSVGDDPVGAAIIQNFTERFPEREAADQVTPPPPVQPPTPPAPPAPNPVPPPVPPASGHAPGWPGEPPAPQPRSRKPNREQIVTPDEPDDDDDYFNKKSWLV
ncbi:YbaB/EbfC family nucleoid-associated protein [Nocardia sp. NPDC050793]|uniref:YbaB/EbfC family nucleoid-associated protein n=1 Tax=Nocardia sp. NPDC050793 TaxID=3155159 RepID=UPI0033C6AF83